MQSDAISEFTYVCKRARGLTPHVDLQSIDLGILVGAHIKQYPRALPDICVSGPRSRFHKYVPEHK